MLVVRAADLLADPIIWERMKRVLRERRIGAEDPLGPLGLYATSLRPVPVAIHVRVVLVGPPDLYATLLEADADFASLFRVKVEVEPTIPRTPKSLARSTRTSWRWPGARVGPVRSGRTRAAARSRDASAGRSREACADPVAARGDGGVRQRARGRRAPPGEPAGRRGPTEDEAARARGRSGVRSRRRRSLVTAEDIEAAWRERRERAGSAERHIREITLRGEIALDTGG